jgi:hypothetical protein
MLELTRSSGLWQSSVVELRSKSTAAQTFEER